MLFLLGFIGIAVDFGRLFVIKTEMQTAMDSCALAAAQELDKASDAITRATNAGRTAGNRNRVNFQGEEAGIVDTDVTFSDTLTGAYSHTYPAANAKYAKCTHTKSGITPLLLKAMSAFSGNASYAADLGVFATAVATTLSAQTNCLLPVGVCQKSAGSPMGFAPGEWLLGVSDETENVQGNFRWLDFDGKGGGANQGKDRMLGNGQCDLPGKDTVAKPGNANGAVAAWNTRFGIYHGYQEDDPIALPDSTGYAWYYDGMTAPTSLWGRYRDTLTLDDYEFYSSTSNASQRPYQNIDALGIQGKPISGDDHKNRGTRRRVVSMPVLDCDALDTKGSVKISGIGCFLMLHPIEKKGGKNKGYIWMEYINDATSPTNNACPTFGLAGGEDNAQVPALVQ
jgi:Flp pilus assembly protein TadG